MNTAINPRSLSIPAAIAAGFLALGYAMTAVSARAETPESLTKRVSYSDLNMDSESGAKVFYARVRNAAEFVCSSLEDRDLSRQRIWRACIDSAITAAVTQVNKPAVTALHNRTLADSKG